MKRFHVHVNVQNLEDSIRFYSRLFGSAPNVQKPDYAKWMLDDPRLNFAISQRGRTPGLDHLGMQVEAAEDLDEIGTRLRAAEAISLSETATTCCYARSDKHWANDPQGVRWETFRTLGEATTYSATSPDGQVCCGPDAVASSSQRDQATCGPQTSGDSSCCGKNG